jgi:hypothetical protein
MRDTLAQLGDTPATLHMEVIDLAGSPSDTAQSVKRLDEKYGPISHLYAIAGITNYLKEDNPLNLVSPSFLDNFPLPQLQAKHEPLSGNFREDDWRQCLWHDRSVHGDVHTDEDSPVWQNCASIMLLLCLLQSLIASSL